VPEAALLSRARDACRAALEEGGQLRPLWRAWRAGAPALVKARALLPGVRTYRRAVPRLRQLKAALLRDGLPAGGGAFERFLIVSAACDAIPRLDGLAVDERVKYLFLQSFETYASGRRPEAFDLSSASFVAVAQIATLSRFPAGQLDWEVSGVPRSWLVRARVLAWGRLTAALVDLGGFGPAFFSHLSPNRRNQGILLERESLRSYHRMARSMERQPNIRGLITASWFHSPDTFVVSPHLTWLNDVFVQHGGYVIPMGRVDAAESGVLHRSPEREQAYEAGTFTPTEALVIWPRSAMLAWARGHQELRDEAARRSMMRAHGARA
jgi:hypothetical protein